MYHIFIIRQLNLDNSLMIELNCGNHILNRKQLKTCLSRKTTFFYNFALNVPDVLWLGTCNTVSISGIDFQSSLEMIFIDDDLLRSSKWYVKTYLEPCQTSKMRK